jgi:hypothetical protein
MADPAAPSLCVYRPIGKDRFDRGELREPGGKMGKIESKVLEDFEIDPLRLFADLA